MLHLLLVCAGLLSSTLIQESLQPVTLPALTSENTAMPEPVPVVKPIADNENSVTPSGSLVSIGAKEVVPLAIESVFEQSKEGMSSTSSKNQIPSIDFVYTWYNSADEATRRIREEILAKYEERSDTSSDAKFKGRYQDNDELKYSLRSVAKYAPWVRKIFIVVGDGQPLPGWLNPYHPKIQIVRHSQFYPSDDSKLPTFNSLSIESCLHRIRGLSDFFVYFNDDIFLGNEVWPGTFVNNWGQAKIWIDEWRTNEGHVSSNDDGHTAAEKNTNNLLRELVRNRKSESSIIGKTMLHMVKVMTKQMMGTAEDAAPDRFHSLRHQQFRSRKSISPIMFASMLCVLRGHCENAAVPSSYFSNINEEPHPRKVFDDIRHQKPMFFCLNNGVDKTVSQGLTTLFPRKSPYEN